MVHGLETMARLNAEASKPPGSDVDQIRSLQRELAEAKAERDQWRAAVRDYVHGDAVVFCPPPSLHEAAMRSVPGPSDAKGEKSIDFWTLDKANACIRGIGMALGIDDPGTTAFGIGLRIVGAIESLKSRASLTPLTSPIVRGVLVDDGPVRNVFDYGECYLDLEDGSINTCWENARDPWSHNMQPVKLRPASEFGVPDLDLTNDLLAKLSDALGIKFDRRVGAWLDPILEAIAKLKSTPAEPAQKLVPLPKGAVVLLKCDSASCEVHDHEGIISNSDVSVHYRRLDPALCGVDAERVRELEALVQKVNAANELLAEHCEKHHAEAERLRKAINEALMMLRQLDDPEQEVVFMDIHAPTEILEAALTPPTAASGEAFQIDPAWLMKMADAEDAVGGLAIGVSPFVSQSPSAPAAESEPRDECAVDFMSAASEPEDGEDLEESDVSEGGERPEIQWDSDALANLAVYRCEFEEALSAETDAHVSRAGRHLVTKRDVDATVEVTIGKIAGKKIDALSARLAACEERCKAMERVVYWARVEARDGTALGDAFKKLDALLAPKAEGGKVQ